MHGLFIPDRSHLVVDLETLTEYFHLVIFDYFECLYCGSQRHSAQAAQQHMIGKGHCKIDILSEDSEFRDFYDFDSCSEDSESDGEQVKSVRESAKAIIVDNSMRLTSGKVLSHRKEGKLRLHRHRTTDTKEHSISTTQPRILDGSPTQPDSTPNQAAHSDSKRLAKREAVYQHQLANLRASDRRSIMHLTGAQQRANIAKAKKQIEQGRRDQYDWELKMQFKADRRG